MAIQGVNETTSNETSTQTNGTLVNETGIIPEPPQTNGNLVNETGIIPQPSIKNDTGTGNETLNNIPPLQEIPNLNDTDITDNETQGNQSGPLPTEENNSPEAFDQRVSVDKDGQVDITLGATDEDKDPLKFDVTADPMQGTLSNFDGEKGTATYIPKQGYSGSDHFRFRAIDDKGFESNVAQVDINIDEVSVSNKTQANGLTESEKDTTNQTST